MNILKQILLFAGCMAITSMSVAQDQLKFQLGDNAPELKYSKWIKGTPISAYEKDRLYAFEFWATWCGPCKAAIPHLSELAKKYKDKATIIGVNVWEKTGDQPYESSLPAVTKFVSNMGDKMAYSVIADNNEQHMGNKWLLQAGQDGIPCTFLLQNSKVIWIGHPSELDSIMESVIGGKYDLSVSQKKFAAGMARYEEMASKFKVIAPIQSALDAKQYAKALKLVESTNSSDKDVAMSLTSMKFLALLGLKKGNQALDFAKNWQKTDQYAGGFIAYSIAEMDGLSRAAYLYAAELYTPMLKGERAVPAVIYHHMAAVYKKAGDRQKAIAYEEKAIDEAKKSLREGKHQGSILEYTVTEYEESLAALKKGTKTS